MILKYEPSLEPPHISEKRLRGGLVFQAHRLLYHSTVVKLQGNHLTSIPENIHLMADKLRALYLGRNRLECLPKVIFLPRTFCVLACEERPKANIPLDHSSRGLRKLRKKEKKMPENIHPVFDRLRALYLGRDRLEYLPKVNHNPTSSTLLLSS